MSVYDELFGAPSESVSPRVSLYNDLFDVPKSPEEIALEEEAKRRKLAEMEALQPVMAAQWAGIQNEPALEGYDPQHPGPLAGGLSVLANRTGEAASGLVDFVGNIGPTIESLGNTGGLYDWLVRPFTDVAAAVAGPIGETLAAPFQESAANLSQTPLAQSAVSTEQAARADAGPLGNVGYDVLGVAPQVAEMVAVGGAPAMGLLGAQAAGQRQQQALAEGATPQEAGRTGVLSGAVEVASEASGIGTLSRLSKVLDGAALRTLEQIAKTVGANAGPEAAEEMLAQAGNEIINRSTSRDGKPLDWTEVKEILGRIGYSGLVGGVSGAAIGGASAATRYAPAAPGRETPPPVAAEPRSPVLEAPSEPVAEQPVPVEERAYETPLAPEPVKVAGGGKITLDPETKAYIRGEDALPAGDYWYRGVTRDGDETQDRIGGFTSSYQEAEKFAKNNGPGGRVNVYRGDQIPAVLFGVDDDVDGETRLVSSEEFKKLRPGAWNSTRFGVELPPPVRQFSADTGEPLSKKITPEPAAPPIGELPPGVPPPERRIDRDPFFSGEERRRAPEPVKEQPASGVPESAAAFIAQPPSFLQDAPDQVKSFVHDWMTGRGPLSKEEFDITLEKEPRVKVRTLKAQQFVRSLQRQRDLAAKSGKMTKEAFDAAALGHFMGEEGAGEKLNPLARRAVEEIRSQVDQQQLEQADIFERQADRIEAKEPAEAETLRERAAYFRARLGIAAPAGIVERVQSRAAENEDDDLMGFAQYLAKPTPDPYGRRAYRAFSEPGWASSGKIPYRGIAEEIKALPGEQASGFVDRPDLIRAFRSSGTWEQAASDIGLSGEDAALDPDVLSRKIGRNKELREAWKAFEQGTNIFSLYGDEQLQGFMENFAARQVGSARGGGVGTADLGMYKRKRDIPAPMRKLLGEYTEPEAILMRSVTDPARNIETFKMYEKFAGTERVSDEPKPGYRQMPGERSRNPLVGKYLPEEVVQELTRDPWAPKGKLSKFLLWLRSTAFGNVTVRSLPTVARNITGTIGQRAVGGDLLNVLTPWFWKGGGFGNGGAQYARVWRDEMQLGKDSAINKAVAKREEAIAAENPSWSKARVRTEAEETVNLTDIHKEAYTRILDEVSRISSDLSDFIGPKDNAVKPEWESSLGNVLERASSFLNTMYGAPDAATKNTMLEIERRKQLYMNEGMSPAEAKRRAMAITSAVYPTPSRAVRGVRFAREQVPTGFVTFWSEVYRTSSNSMRIGANEVREGFSENNAKKVTVGMHRMASVAVSLVATEILVKAVGGALLKAVLPEKDRMKELTDEEKKTIQTGIQVYLTTRQENSISPVLFLGDGIAIVSDTTSQNPLSPVSKPLLEAPVLAYRRGEGAKGMAWNAFKELVRAFPDRSMFSSVFEAKNGVTADGRRVWQENDDDGVKAWKAFAHVATQVGLPRFVLDAQDLSHAAKRGDVEDFARLAARQAGIHSRLIRVDDDYPRMLKRFRSERDGKDGVKATFHRTLHAYKTDADRERALSNSLSAYENSIDTVLRATAVARAMVRDDDRLDLLVADEKLGDTGIHVLNGDKEALMTELEEKLREELDLFKEYGEKWRDYQ